MVAETVWNTVRVMFCALITMATLIWHIVMTAGTVTYASLCASWMRFNWKRFPI